MEYLKIFIDIIFSIFNNKSSNDKDTENMRNLYVDNYKSFKKNLKTFLGSAQVDIELLQEANNVLSEAKLYLHSDIINLNEKVMNLLGEHYPIDKRLSDNSFEDEEIRLKRIDRRCEIEIELGNLYQNSYKVYRKHIIQYPKEKIKYLLEDLIDSSFILSWLKSKIQRRIDPETSSG